MSAHVAVDIGASSGRVIVAEYEDNHFETSEVHRFKNGFGQVDGHDRWNIDVLFQNISLQDFLILQSSLPFFTSKNTKRAGIIFPTSFILIYNTLHIKSKFHNIAILNNIFFSFFTQPSCFLDCLFTPIFY